MAAASTHLPSDELMNPVLRAASWYKPSRFRRADDGSVLCQDIPANNGWLQRRHIRDKMGSLHCAVGL